MAVDQLAGQVREFASYLDGLMARLDQGGGWCGIFWRRDPEGMRACLDGLEMPPWDVVEALLQDLGAAYGPAAATAERQRAGTLYAAALTAYDARPGARDALVDRLDVMLREQRYAAERQAELSRLLSVPASREETESLRVDLAWARDDHDRAAARCAELRSRMADLDRRSMDGRPGTPTAHGHRPDPTHQAADATRTARTTDVTDVARVEHTAHVADAGWVDHPARAEHPARAARPAEAAHSAHVADAGWAARTAGVADAVQAARAARVAAVGWAAQTADAANAAQAEHIAQVADAAQAEHTAHVAHAGWVAHTADVADAGWAEHTAQAERPAEAAHTAQAAEPAQVAEPARAAQPDTAARAQQAGPAHLSAQSASARQPHQQYLEQHRHQVHPTPPPAAAVQTYPADPPPPAAQPAHAAPAVRATHVVADPAGQAVPPAAGAPVDPPAAAATPLVQSAGTSPVTAGSSPRKRRRGSARFAGMVEDEAVSGAIPQAPGPSGGRPTPRGARFAGAEAEAVLVPAPVDAVDDGAVEAVDGAVERLARLRAEGRSGEAHVLLVEATWWPPARFPLLADALHRAGLGADWATLLWEAASLPAERLVAAADALTAAGRDDDGQQMLRQGVARPAEQIGAAVLRLDGEGRRREVRALLDAYVRVRAPEEAARSVAADPGRLVPPLLEAAHAVSDQRYWDLVHALRVAGHTP